MSSLRPSVPRLLPGTMLAGTYRIERPLRESATGMLLEATDVAAGKPVAVKVLRRSKRTPELTARFAREVPVARQLSSEHLARIDASGHTDSGDPFLVTELLHGHDLAAEIERRGPLPVAEAVDIVVEACAGVAEAHAAGLVHRDLKPTNLFVVGGRAEKIKVLDFGLTRVPNEKGRIDLAATEADFGTPQYLAPEQIRASHPGDARTDQHALAAILHELVTGRPPFVAPDVTRLAVAIALDPPPAARTARPEVPAALDEAIRRALAKRPEDRFPDLLAFAEAIAPFGGERACEALLAVRAVLVQGVARSVPPPPSPRGPAPVTADAASIRAHLGPRLAAASALAALVSVGVYFVAARPAPSVSSTSVATATGIAAAAPPPPSLPPSCSPVPAETPALAAERPPVSKDPPKIPAAPAEPAKETRARQAAKAQGY